MLLDALEQAIRQMVRNPVRTALTSLGVLIGVAAVITMVTAGQGATARVEEDVGTLGGNLLFVVPGSQEGFGATRLGAELFTEADALALEEEVPGIRSVAPAGSEAVVAVRDDRRWRTEIRGSTNAWLDAIGFDVADGRRFEEGEVTAGAGVCLLGETVRRQLFGGEPAVDGEVRLGDASCRVVGSLAPKGENTFGVDQDDFVLVPLRFFQRRVLGRPDVPVLFVLAEDDAPVDRLRADVEALMDRRRHIAPGAERNYTVRDMGEMMDLVRRISAILTSFLAAIAGVSLLVGGIGIMNIMLVSVTERTREIGIRLAIGAQARDVLLQFVVEAVVLSAVGGVAGVGAAVLLSWGITRWIGVPLVLDPLVVALSVGASAAIGVLFGWWPARRAARLRPIDALRHE